MSQSASRAPRFDEINFAGLSEEGRRTLHELALPIAENATYAELAAETGRSRTEIAAAMSDLRNELITLSTRDDR